jgi:hypothetical protein
MRPARNGRMAFADLVRLSGRGRTCCQIIRVILGEGRVAVRLMRCPAIGPEVPD